MIVLALLLSQCLTLTANAWWFFGKHPQCESPIKFSAQFYDWENLCLGAPYRAGQNVYKSQILAYDKLIYSYADKSIVYTIEETYDKINVCCEEFHRSDLYKKALKSETSRADRAKGQPPVFMLKKPPAPVEKPELVEPALKTPIMDKEEI